MKKLLTSTGVVLSILALSATVALASVTFNTSDGTGFVGKGDIQTPWGWNNQTLQLQAGNLSFSYDAQELYDVTCEWDTETGHGTIHHSVTHATHHGVNDTVAYTSRTHKQVDGFNLTGYGIVSETGSVPVVGDSCLGDPVGALVTAVTLISSSGPELTVSDVSLSLGPLHIWP